MFHVSHLGYQIGWKAGADLNLLTERSNHYKVSQGIKWTHSNHPCGCYCVQRGSFPPSCSDALYTEEHVIARRMINSRCSNSLDCVQIKSLSAMSELHTNVTLLGQKWTEEHDSVQRWGHKRELFVYQSCFCSWEISFKEIQAKPANCYHFSMT